MQPHELSPLVEALLFVSDRPLTQNALVKAVNHENVSVTEIKNVLDALSETYDAQRHGFKLIKLGSGYQVVTRERYASWVEGMLTGKKKLRLSRAALETASVIAYKQPVSRVDIERIRGVDAGGVLNTLLERNLILIKGRDPGPGRALLYGTTQTFLEYFGLSKLTDLPRLDEIAALARAEVAVTWEEDELARFERHGVEPISLEDEDVAEADASPADKEAEAPVNAEVVPDPETQEADRAGFKDVVAEMAGDDTPAATAES